MVYLIFIIIQAILLNLKISIRSKYFEFKFLILQVHAYQKL